MISQSGSMPLSSAPVESSICADTSFIIDLFNGKSEAVNRSKEFGSCVITYPSVFEFMVGIYSTKNEKAVDDALKFISAFDILPTYMATSLKAAKIEADLMREGKVIEPMDCLIACVALSHGYSKLLTRNKEHFERIEGLEPLSY